MLDINMGGRVGNYVLFLDLIFFRFISTKFFFLISLLYSSNLMLNNAMSFIVFILYLVH